MRVLGIDPGTAITGWGIVDVEDKKGKSSDKLTARGYGCIKTESSMIFSRRLSIIYKELKELIKEYKPDVVAIEELFFAKNVKTALKVGHARGVVILAAVNANLDVAEYTPLQVKQALTGYGRADKQQIQRMVKTLLWLKEIPKPDDVADALAVAVCHINSRKIEKLCITG
ncbi:MAG: crossover junction endodeoxyribonuclease RuvC [bacterium]